MKTTAIKMSINSAVSAAKMAISANLAPPFIARRSCTSPDITPSRIATVNLIVELISGVPESVA